MYVFQAFDYLVLIWIYSFPIFVSNFWCIASSFFSIWICALLHRHPSLKTSRVFSLFVFFLQVLSFLNQKIVSNENESWIRTILFLFWLFVFPSVVGLIWGWTKWSTSGQGYSHQINPHPCFQFGETFSGTPASHGFAPKSKVSQYQPIPSPPSSPLIKQFPFCKQQNHRSPTRQFFDRLFCTFSSLPKNVFFKHFLCFFYSFCFWFKRIFPRKQCFFACETWFLELPNRIPGQKDSIKRHRVLLFFLFLSQTNIRTPSYRYWVQMIIITFQSFPPSLNWESLRNFSAFTSKAVSTELFVFILLLNFCP